MDNRIFNYRMEFYRQTYADSPLWLGKKSLEGKRLIIYCEQGRGDTIQFIRYASVLKKQGCHIIVACSENLHCLLPYIDGVDEWYNKANTDLPTHDFHVLSLDLPFLVLDSGVDINKWWEGKEPESYMPQVTAAIPDTPYINFTEQVNMEEAELPPGTNIGIAWEGNPSHWNNADRSCPLKYFRNLSGNLFSLQKDIHKEYIEDCDDIVLMGSELNDFKDTLRLINAMDVVVTVDTVILHLAGALNKMTCALLGNEPDMRWGGKKSPWYPSVSFYRRDGDWDSVFDQFQINYVPKQKTGI